MRRVSSLILICCLGLLAGCEGKKPNRIVIGAKYFTEQAVLAEILAQHIEAKTGLAADRRVNLGGTLICHRAIRAGEIDLYVEYTGTALTAVLGEPPSGDPKAVFERVKKGYLDRFGLEVLDPLGFNNTFAIVVRGEEARRHRLKTISDAVPYAAKWRAGFGYEFMERPDGFPGLAKAYGLHFVETPRTLELGLLYRALMEKQVDIVAGNSTDGVIAAHDLVVLEDDRKYFPPYEAVPVVRQDTLAKFPALGGALNDLAGKISEDEMRRMNFAVDGERRDPKDVASEFLRAKRL